MHTKQLLIRHYVIRCNNKEQKDESFPLTFQDEQIMLNMKKQQDGITEKKLKLRQFPARLS